MRDVWGKGISIKVYMKELIKEDLVVHPKIIIDQIGDYQEPNRGHTVLHSAIEHALKTKQINHVKSLMQLGCPMYYGTKGDKTIIAPLF